MKNSWNYRSIEQDLEFETRQDGDREVIVISGIGSPFYDGTPATEYRILPNLVERVDPNAFDAVLADSSRDVMSSVNHDIERQLLGRRSAGSLQLSKTERGLRFEVTPGDTSIARDAIELIRRREITGASIWFGYETDELWTTDGDMTVVTLRMIPLIEVGPVSRPAFDAATAMIEMRKRDLAEFRKNEKQEGEILHRRIQSEWARMRIREHEGVMLWDRRRA